ncbi:MAG: ribosome biogenesis GTPase Der [Legionellaceae bacterium]|nr:ribosome biogenesis GTPase Der [Legionellaceae bacterium]
MLPVVVLVGRPNVGKSTLFNRFTRKQDAIVSDYPGLTRDRQYGDVNWTEHPFIVVDTGGIGVDDMAVDALMSHQSQLAMQEADVVLFMVDGRAGLTPLDETIANQLRHLNKSVIIVVNKTDGLDEQTALADFSVLGFPVLAAISAAHGRGMQYLLEKIYPLLPPQEPVDTSVELPEGAIRIAFVGRPNVGKSTLVNRMLGEERVITYDMPGTTRDSIYIPFERDGQRYVLIDTAGVRRRGRIDEKIEKFSVIKSLQAVKDSHVCLMLIDAREGLTEQDMHLLGFTIESGRALVIVVNKWDGLDDEWKDRIRTELDRRLQFAKFAKTRYISALHGSGVGTLYPLIQDAYAAANQSFSTPRLTRLLEDIVAQHQPPLVNGRRVKLRYAHGGGQNPPIIVIHGNQLDALPQSYKRYLNNAFVEHLNIAGTPLLLEFKTGDNPYKDKRNRLSPRQVRHRQRLMKKVKKRAHKK